MYKTCRLLTKICLRQSRYRPPGNLAPFISEHNYRFPRIPPILLSRGVKSYDAELDTAKLEELQAPAREGFVAVEWGGMNLNGKMQH